MDNDPKSYRVPILHLSDVLPTENAPASDTTNAGAQDTPAVEPVDESQKLHEEFVMKTMAAMKQQAATAPTVQQAQTPPPQQLRTEEEILEEETPFVLDVDLAGKEEGVEILQPPEQIQRPQSNESILERFVTKAAEKLDSLSTPHVPAKETTTHVKVSAVEEGEGEEIASIFDSYLKANPEVEEKNPDIIAEVNTAPLLPDPLDIWEQDAAKPKNETFQRTSFTSSVQKLPDDRTGNVVHREPIQRIQPAPVNVDKKSAYTYMAEEKVTEEESQTQEETDESQKKNEVLTPIEKPSQQGTYIAEDLTPEQEKASVFSMPEKKEELPSSSKSSSNLSMLRERIAKENTSFTSPADPKTLDNEHATLSANVSEKLSVIETVPQTKEVLTSRPKPQSKHAQVLSSVADRLHNLSTSTDSVQSKENVPLLPIEGPVEDISNGEQNVEISTKTKKSSLAPGEIREPEPVVFPNSSLSPIRTFRQDVEQAVTKNKTSVVNMISAEQNKRTSGKTTIRTAPRPVSSSLSYVFIGASVVLVFGAIAIGIFLFISSLASDKPENTAVISSINKTVSYIITDQSKEQILSDLVKLRDSTHFTLGSMTEIELLTRTIESIAGSENLLTSRIEPTAFLEKIAPQAPDALKRAATKTLILGIHEMTKNQVFLYFNVNHRDVAFRGMFEWEETMNSDLAPLFGFPIPRKVVYQQNTSFASPNSATTSSTTPSVEQTATQQAPVYEKIIFEDLLVANKEARGLRNADGELVLLWTMPNDETVLITSNQTTMQVILEQLAVDTHTR